MPFDDDFDDNRAASGNPRLIETWPHSGIGIASFIAGLVALLMIVGAFAVAVVVAVEALPTGPSGRNPQQLFFVGVLFIGAGLVAVVGTGLGIGACFQTKRKKVFAVIGLVVNGLVLLGAIGVFLLGVIAIANTHP
jgi:hypothetical protein